MLVVTTHICVMRKIIKCCIGFMNLSKWYYKAFCFISWFTVIYIPCLLWVPRVAHLSAHLSFTLSLISAGNEPWFLCCPACSSLNWDACILCDNGSLTNMHHLLRLFLCTINKILTVWNLYLLLFYSATGARGSIAGWYYATSWKITCLSPDKIIEFFQFT